MVGIGGGICRRAYGQAHVQCSDARDLSAPLTLQRGDHSATQAQSVDSSPFLCQNMGYRGQSCEDERMLWEFIDQPFPEGWTGVC